MSNPPPQLQLVKPAKPTGITSLNPLARAYSVGHLHKAKDRLGKLNQGRGTTSLITLVYQREVSDHIDMALKHLNSEHAEGHVARLRSAIGHLGTVMDVINANLNDLHSPKAMTEAMKAISDHTGYALDNLKEISSIEGID